MNKLLKNVIIGVVSGTAAIYFPPTEKSKKFQKKTAKAHEAYKENPTECHQKAEDETIEYADLTVDIFNDYRQRFKSGELAIDEFLDTVKKKGKTVAGFASEGVSGFTSKVSKTVNEVEEAKEETGAEVGDIIIDYTQSKEAPATEKPETTIEEADEE